MLSTASSAADPAACRVLLSARIRRNELEDKCEHTATAAVGSLSKGKSSASYGTYEKVVPNEIYDESATGSLSRNILIVLKWHI